MTKKLCSILQNPSAILALLLIGLLSFSFSSRAVAETLYERSLKQLEAKLQTACPDDFTFVVLGDSRDNDAMFRKSLLLAKSFHPLFILHNGDVVSMGTEETFHHFLGVVQNAAPETPLFVAMGNHDLTRHGKSGERKILFQKKIAPLNYTVDAVRLNLRVIVLDNALYQVTPEQLLYLQQRLTEDRTFNFVAMHVPPRIERWNNDHSFSEGAEDLVRILSEGNITRAFFGHMHVYDETVAQGIRYILTGGAGAPLRHPGYGASVYHIVLVHVKDGVVHTKMVPVR